MYKSRNCALMLLSNDEKNEVSGEKTCLMALACHANAKAKAT